MGSLSPILSSASSPRPPNRSPAGIKRRPASFHARTPRTPRPNDLKVTPFSRMLNTPTSVDSLPRLRRFHTSQSQISSFAYLGNDENPGNRENQETTDSKENIKDKEGTVEKKGAGTPQPPTTEAAKERGDERRADRTEEERAPLRSEVKQSRTQEVLSQPVSEIQGAARSRVKGDPQDKRGLVEVTLSGVKPQENQDQEKTREGEDQKMCCGFFFKVTCRFKHRFIIIRNSYKNTTSF